MRYARDAWNAERASWRSVIQLNVIRSVVTIVRTLQAEMDGERPESPLNPRHSLASGDNRSDNSPQQSPRSHSPPLLNGKHQLLQFRLGPLRHVETDLKRRLGAQADEEEEGNPDSLGALGLAVETPVLYQTKREFGVCRLTEALAQGVVPPKDTRGSDPSHNSISIADKVVDEVTEVLASCKDDMMALWSDLAVRTVLKKWNVRLEDSAGL